MVVVAEDVEYSLWMARIDSGGVVAEGGFERVVDRGDEETLECVCCPETWFEQEPRRCDQSAQSSAPAFGACSPALRHVQYSSLMSIGMWLWCRNERHHTLTRVCSGTSLRCGL